MCGNRCAAVEDAVADAATAASVSEEDHRHVSATAMAALTPIRFPAAEPATGDG